MLIFLVLKILLFKNHGNSTTPVSYIFFAEHEESKAKIFEDMLLNTKASANQLQEPLLCDTSIYIFLAHCHPPADEPCLAFDQERS